MSRPMASLVSGSVTTLMVDFAHTSGSACILKSSAVSARLSSTMRFTLSGVAPRAPWLSVPSMRPCASRWPSRVRKVTGSVPAGPMISGKPVSGAFGFASQ
ncbi:hypothetical protein D3C87_1149710 [compost metagenome]